VGWFVALVLTMVGRVYDEVTRGASFPEGQTFLFRAAWGSCFFTAKSLRFVDKKRVNDAMLESHLVSFGVTFSNDEGKYFYMPRDGSWSVLYG
jgi:hypothetical protein